MQVAAIATVLLFAVLATTELQKNHRSGITLQEGELPKLDPRPISETPKPVRKHSEDPDIKESGSSKHCGGLSSTPEPCVPKSCLDFRVVSELRS